MKTYIYKFDNCFRIELCSELHSKVHAFAYISFFRRNGNLFGPTYWISNIDLNQSAYSVFVRFCSNSSLSYLDNQCGSVDSAVTDLELDFEFENL